MSSNDVSSGTPSLSAAEIRRSVRGKVTQTTDHVATVCYSNAKNESAKIDTGSNHARALLFAAVHGATIIDKTPAGTIFDSITPNLYHVMIQQFGLQQGRLKADAIMRLTSREMMNGTHGEVRTYVCGASSARVFRYDELGTMMENRDIKHINGVSRARFEPYYQQDQRTHAALPVLLGKRIELKQTFRAICLSELRQDRDQALRTGDAILMADVITRQEVYRRQQAEERGIAKAITETPQQTQARIARQSARLTAAAQDRNRREASAGIETIMADRRAAGQLTPEKAAQIRTTLRQKLADPQRAYRINTGLKMQAVLKTIKQDGDTYAVKRYTALLTNLLLDTRMMNFLRAQSAIASPPVPATTENGAKFATRLHATQGRSYRNLVAATRHAPRHAGNKTSGKVNLTAPNAAAPQN